MRRRGYSDSAYSLQKSYIAEMDSFRLINEPTEVMRAQNLMELNRLEEEMTRSEFNHRLYTLYICIAGLIIIVLLSAVLYVRERRHKSMILRNMNHKIQAEKEMERSRRQLIALSLAREESEKTIASIRDKIESLRSEGKVSSEEASCIDAAIRNHTIQRSDWEMFQEQFEKTSPDFIKNLRQRAPGITENQIRLATYIHIGMTNKQISSFMNIRPESIKQARWRLRSRLGLPAEESLEEFLTTLS